MPPSPASSVPPARRRPRDVVRHGVWKEGAVEAAPKGRGVLPAAAPARKRADAPRASPDGARVAKAPPAAEEKRALPRRPKQDAGHEEEPQVRQRGKGRRPSDASCAARKAGAAVAPQRPKPASKASVAAAPRQPTGASKTIVAAAPQRPEGASKTTVAVAPQRSEGASKTTVAAAPSRAKAPAPQQKSAGTDSGSAVAARPRKRSAAPREEDAEGAASSDDDQDFPEDFAIDMGSDSDEDEAADTTAVDDYDDEDERQSLPGEDSDATFAGSGADDDLPGDSLSDSEEERDEDESFRWGSGALWTVPVRVGRCAPGGRVFELTLSGIPATRKATGDYLKSSLATRTTNTVGNIPMEWYDELPHIGYDRDGKRILKPATKDELEAFLANVDDADGWRTVHDRLGGKDVVLNDEELDIIRRLYNQQFTDANYDPYAPWVDFFSSKTMETPLSSAPEPKRRFVPSKWEAKTESGEAADPVGCSFPQGMKIVRAIRQGRIVRGKPRVPPKPKFYDLWGLSGGDHDASAKKANHPMHVPAPKVKLPDHAESYNPPSEYLLTEEELKEWEEADPEDRERNFVPAKYDNLRSVPAYSKFINDMFERCLDLYMCPRMNIDPESLIPKLPDPRDLEPFPRYLAVTYRGHTRRIRCLSVDPSGLWLATGSDDGDVRMWELATGRCVRVWHTGDEPVQAFAEKFVAAGFALSSQPSAASVGKSTASTWSRPTSQQESEGWRAVVRVVRGVIKQLAWHKKGDYFLSTAPDGEELHVMTRKTTISKHLTQSPFKKAKGLVQKALFHPTKPLLFVAVSSSYLRNSDSWISSMDIHPSGDHLLVGSYDRRGAWFDLDLSPRPYKTLMHHSAAVRSVAYASRSGYPLFATASDDGSVQVFHGQVFADLLQNPLLVPVRRIRGAHEIGDDKLGVLDCQWHPSQPWLLTAGADGLAKLWS
ncbi:MAG: NUC169 domain-containing protein [Olpidium bornovanus]|uniref:Ribosome biogenesis protein ERB1 n=1 Tax=Olpidium bornovanus TaxID=278681 RepID=A0A8H7ZQT3_9FUNG|nr:MAG: NUC169 domain-containing protein [Olpidium bornovanus]